eukprot:793633-Pelagomonas_calceolata.AAC.1
MGLSTVFPSYDHATVPPQESGHAANFLTSTVAKKVALGAALTFVTVVFAIVLGLIPVYIESSQSSTSDALPATIGTNAPSSSRTF